MDSCEIANYLANELFMQQVDVFFFSFLGGQMNSFEVRLLEIVSRLRHYDPIQSVNVQILVKTIPNCNLMRI